MVKYQLLYEIYYYITTISCLCQKKKNKICLDCYAKLEEKETGHFT